MTGGRCPEATGRHRGQVTAWVMAGQPLDVAAFLEARRDAVLRAAHDGVDRRGLAHYRAAGTDETRARLQALFDVVVGCCAEHRIEPALDYAQTLAVERHATDHSLGEVQSAINILEEALWRTLTSEAPPDVQGYALGLVSTVLGAVKDRVACTYVAQVSSKPLATLRLDSLFEGREGDVHPI